MTEWIRLKRDGTRLALADFGGEGRPVVFLHGLAGHAEEWLDTATWLRKTHRVLGLDLRGHGRSERRPDGVSPNALTADAAVALAHVGEPVILVGQSLGGAIALRVAVSHPELVRALVIVEASPGGLEEEEESHLVDEVGDNLRAWPVPFEAEEQALRFFDGPSLAAAAWVRGLEKRENGLWPRFDAEVLVAMLQALGVESYWPAWESITCPTLVVRGKRGFLSEHEAAQMSSSLPSARLATIEAGHDVHLDNPEAWREVLSAFLAEIV